jgi:hypothetical protein
MTNTTTDRMMSQHLSTNIFLPHCTQNLIKEGEELNYDNNNVPNYIENHEDELLFLHAWLNPATYEKTKHVSEANARRDFLNGSFEPSTQSGLRTNSEKNLSTNWNKVYFGQKLHSAGTNGNKKHGTGTILRKDASRFHGMYVNNAPLGLGISVDNKNNFELGFYKNKKVQIFGVNHMNFGDKYIGGYLGSCYQGPGICYSENLDRWLFGSFDKSNVDDVLINRLGKLKKEHFYLEGFQEHLIYAAFGNIPKIKRSVFRQVLKEAEFDFTKMSPGESALGEMSNFLRKNTFG